MNKKISEEQQQQYFPMLCHSVILSVQDIECAIKNLNMLKICYGAVLTSKFPNVKASISSQCVKVNGYWKHLNCSSFIRDNRY